MPGSCSQHSACLKLGGKQGRSPLNLQLHVQLVAGSIYQLIPRERP